MLQITCHHVSTFLVAKMADSTDSTESVNALVPKKKAISPVWDHFGQCVDGEGRVIDSDVAVCRRCQSNVRASGGNTSNLLSHLRVHYPGQYTQVLQLQKTKAKENDKRVHVRVRLPKPSHPSQNCSIKLRNMRGPHDDGMKLRTP